MLAPVTFLSVSDVSERNDRHEIAINVSENQTLTIFSAFSVRIRGR